MDKLNNLLVDAVDMGITIAVLLVFLILTAVLFYLTKKILTNLIGENEDEKM